VRLPRHSLLVSRQREVAAEVAEGVGVQLHRHDPDVVATGFRVLCFARGHPLDRGCLMGIGVGALEVLERVLLLRVAGQLGVHRLGVPALPGVDKPLRGGGVPARARDDAGCERDQRDGDHGGRTGELSAAALGRGSDRAQAPAASPLALPTPPRGCPDPRTVTPEKVVRSAPRACALGGR
jgi:hypothetical protein